MPEFRKSPLEYITKIEGSLTCRFSFIIPCSHYPDIIDRPPQSILTTEYEEVFVIVGNRMEKKGKGDWNKSCEQSEIDLTHPAKAKYNELQYYARGKAG